MQKKILFLIILIPSLCAAEIFHLKDILEYALKNSPQLKAAQNQLQIGEIFLQNSKFGFLPTVDLEGRQGVEKEFESQTESSLPNEVSLKLTSKIYDNGLSFINYKNAQIQNDFDRHNFEKQQAQLALEISKLFFKFSETDGVLTIQKIQYEILKKQYLLVQAQYEQGMKPRKDFIRFKSKLQRAELGMKQAAALKENYREEIKEKIGLEIGRLDIEALAPNPEIIKKIPKEFSLIEKHFEYKSADLLKKLNYFEVERVEKKYGPEFFLELNSTYSLKNNLNHAISMENRQDNHWAVFVTLKLNLWDWGIQKRNVTSAILANTNKNIELEAKVLSAQTALNKLKLDIEQMAESFKLNKELVELEKDNFELFQQSYKDGKASFLDLINSLSDYTSSQESYLRDFYSLKSLISEFYYNEGNLNEILNNT